MMFETDTFSTDDILMQRLKKSESWWESAETEIQYVNWFWQLYIKDLRQESVINKVLHRYSSWIELEQLQSIRTMSIKVFVSSLIQYWEHILILLLSHSFFCHWLDSYLTLLLSSQPHSAVLNSRDQFYSLSSKVIFLCNWVCSQTSELNITALNHYMQKWYKFETEKTLFCDNLWKNNCILKVAKQAQSVLRLRSWLWSQVILNLNLQIQTYEFQNCLNSLFRYACNV